MRFKDFTAKATNNSGNGGFGGFVGYAATFDRKPDTYGDVIAKGAFADTIRAWADSIRPVPVFYGHNMDDPDRLITSQIDTAPKSNDAVIEGGAPLRESAQSRRRYH